MVAKPPVDDEATERITDIDVTEEMETSFLEYAYSVIYARAIPDARVAQLPIARQRVVVRDGRDVETAQSHRAVQLQRLEHRRIIFLVAVSLNSFFDGTEHVILEALILRVKVTRTFVWLCRKCHSCLHFILLTDC